MTLGGCGPIRDSPLLTKMPGLGESALPSYLVGRPHVLNIPNPLGVPGPMCIVDQPGGNRPVGTGHGVPISRKSRQNLTGFFKRGNIRIIVAETLAEQKHIEGDKIDAIVLKAITTVLTSFGINEDDKRELRADLSQLRRWRKALSRRKATRSARLSRWL